MSEQGADYKRLGDQLRAARREAGYRTLSAFQAYLDEMPKKQLSGRTYADIENGNLGKRARFSSESLAFLEELFGWFPGASRALLEGRDVDLQTGVSLEDAGQWPAPGQWQPERREWADDIDEAMADVDGRFLALEARVQELERRLLRQRKPALRSMDGGDGDADDTGSSAPTNELDDRRKGLSEAPDRVLRVANKGDVEPEEGALTDP